MRNSLVNKNVSHRITGKPLTKDLIFTKTRNDNLANIKNLNLWGNDLQDLSLLDQMPNLQVISLSVNNIKTLKYFQNSFKLQELYLRKNDIKLLEEIQYLINLPELRVLWLCDNPCANIKNYRQIVLSMLPNLVKLDNDVISQKQRLQQQYIKRNSAQQQSIKKDQLTLETNQSHINNPKQYESVSTNNKSLNEVNLNINNRNSSEYQKDRPIKKNNNFTVELEQNRSQFYLSSNNHSKVNQKNQSTRIAESSIRKSNQQPLRPRQSDQSNYVNMKFEPYTHSDRKNEIGEDNRKHKMMSQGQKSNTKNYKTPSRNQLQFEQHNQSSNSHIFKKGGANNHNIQHHNSSIKNSNEQPQNSISHRISSSSNQNHQNKAQKMGKNTTPNVLMAIISLIDDLDQDGLQIIKRQTQKKLRQLR